MALHHRYSHHVRRALQHAAQLASDYGHARQDTAHLLVGVMLTEGSLGAQVMEVFDVPVPVAKVYLKRLMTPEENIPRRIQHTPRKFTQPCIRSNHLQAKFNIAITNDMTQSPP